MTFEQLKELTEETARVTAEHSNQLVIDGQYTNQPAKIAADTTEAVNRVVNNVDHLIEAMAQHEPGIHRIEDRP
jgi:hypothetical protein